MVDLLRSLSVAFQKARSNDDNRFEADVLSLVRTVVDLAGRMGAGVSGAPFPPV